MASKKASVDEPTRLVHYLVTLVDGQRYRLSIPAAWKVTFGPIWIPRQDRPQVYGGAKQDYVLRVYEAQDKQRAVIQDVLELRDLSIGWVEEKMAASKATDYAIELRSTVLNGPQNDSEKPLTF